MMKIELQSAGMHVRAEYTTQGSVLAQTVGSACKGIHYRLEIDSDEPPERIAGLVRVAEGGCFTLSALREPVEIRGECLLNGQALNPDDYPPPARKG